MDIKEALQLIAIIFDDLDELDTWSVNNDDVLTDEIADISLKVLKMKEKLGGENK